MDEKVYGGLSGGGLKDDRERKNWEKQLLN